MKTNILLSFSALLLIAGALLAVDDKHDHGNTVAVDAKNWEDEVVKSDKPVLVDFWAPWCGPCMKLGPHVASLSKKQTDVKFVKVNLDDNEALAAKFKVETIPHLLVLKGGKVIGESGGYMEEADLAKFVNDSVKQAK